VIRTNGDEPAEMGEPEHLVGDELDAAIRLSPFIGLPNARALFVANAKSVSDFTVWDDPDLGPL